MRGELLGVLLMGRQGQAPLVTGIAKAPRAGLIDISRLLAFMRAGEVIARKGEVVVSDILGMGVPFDDPSYTSLTGYMRLLSGGRYRHRTLPKPLLKLAGRVSGGEGGRRVNSYVFTPAGDRLYHLLTGEA